MMRIFACLVRCIPVVLTVAAPLSAGELLPPDRPVHEAIDHYVGQLLERDGVTPAERAADSTFVRRVTLDLCGRIPTPAEAKAFVNSGEADKHDRLVERLLASPDYARHHRNWLDESLQVDNKSDEEWRDWLLQAARENTPWDEMFREMIAGRESKDRPNPALAFLKARAKSVDDMTNDTSRMFFGVSINCAKCHDHPLVGDWKQDHYFGFLSFFDRTYLTKKDTLAEKYDGAVKFKTTDGSEKRAQMMFLTGTLVAPLPDVRSKQQRKADAALVRRQMRDKDAPDPRRPRFSPRAALVELALSPGQDRYFARSIVNRVWARLFGRGIVEPLDQMHSGNFASHPGLLNWLTCDLVSHGYDLKRLIRGVVLSETYARSSRWDRKGDPPPPDYFAVAVPRPLTPRQYSLSLLLATRAPDRFPPAERTDEWNKLREELETRAEGFAGELDPPGPNFQISVDEALLFSNSERIERDFLAGDRDRLVGRLQEIDDEERLIETAFWSVLSRPPAAEESAAFLSYLKDRQDRRTEGIQQIVWALIASPEMRFTY